LAIIFRNIVTSPAEAVAKYCDKHVVQQKGSFRRCRGWWKRGRSV